MGYSCKKGGKWMHLYCLFSQIPSINFHHHASCIILLRRSSFFPLNLTHYHSRPKICFEVLNYRVCILPQIIISKLYTGFRNRYRNTFKQFTRSVRIIILPRFIRKAEVGYIGNQPILCYINCPMFGFQ